MNILMIDTSGPACGVAIAKEGRIICEMQLTSGKTHSQRVMPMVSSALDMCEMSVSDIDLFGVVVGPGSFTGVRIGVCAAKGLAHAWNKKCARLDALEVLAMNYQGFDGIACAILDARRSQVYCAAFDMKNGLPERILPDDAMEIGAFLEKLPRDRRLVFLGDGLRVHEKRIRETLPQALIAPANLSQLRADAACLLAAERKDTWMEARLLTPIYLRIPQAERERNARLRGEI